MLRIIAALALLATPALAQPADLPAGTYRLDPYHASLVFTVSHLGFSDYTAGFDHFDATLALDPADPASARVTVEIDVASLDLPTPPEGFLDTMLSADWLDAGAHPNITFESTAVRPAGDGTAEVDGQLTLLGTTRPVTLLVRFNGGWASHPMDPAARIGFSATATFLRSAFGLAIGLPPPDSSMGVGDDIRVAIEAEFIGPPAAP